MSNIKLNKKVDSEDFNVMPDAPTMETENVTSDKKESYVKVEVAESRKMFANKKANIGLIVAGSIFAVVLIAAFVFIYVV